MDNPLLSKPVISAAAAGLGAAVGGPLGGALGLWLGSAMGHTAGVLLGSYAEEFGKDAGKKLIEAGGDSLIEKLKKDSPDLEEVFRRSLRLSLKAMSKTSGMGYEDWFAHWERALATPGLLNLQPVLQEDLNPGETGQLIRRILEDLDAQGDQLARKSTSVLQKRRKMPEPLFAMLEQQLPQVLQEHFQVLILTAEYEPAWREAELNFSLFARASLKRMEGRIDAVDQKTELIPEMDRKLQEMHRTVFEILRFMESSAAQQKANEKKKLAERPATAWDEFFETALSQGSVIYEDPWETWETEAERDFKNLLRGRNEKQQQFWKEDRWQEILDLWKPLESNEYFNVEHRRWEDRPYFRSRIHHANSGLFVAHGQLAARPEHQTEHYHQAIHYLKEVLKEHPYAMLGSRYDRLSVDDARVQNENFVTTLRMAQDFLTIWGSPYMLKLLNMPQSEVDALTKTIGDRMGEIRWVLEKHPE
jgi:hypothetical protein